MFCEICHQEFMCFQRYSNHKNLLHSAHNFPCGFCEKSFNKTSALLHHSKLKHSQQSSSCAHSDEKGDDVPLFYCEACGLGFRDVQKRLRHIEQEHNSVYLLCNYCDYSAASLDDLLFHANRHKSIKNTTYSCKLCGKNFYYEHVIVNHLNSHTLDNNLSQKLFGCRFQQHLRGLQTQDSKYYCFVCPQVVKSREKLVWHFNRKHADLVATYESFFGEKKDRCSKEKPKICLKCGKSVVNMKLHHQKSHKTSLFKKYCSYLHRRRAQKILAKTRNNSERNVEDGLCKILEQKEGSGPLENSELKVDENAAATTNVSTKLDTSCVIATDNSEPEKDTGDVKIPCMKCGQAFSIDAFLTHQTVHSDQIAQDIKCTECHTMFDTLNNLVTHMKSLHPASVWNFSYFTRPLFTSLVQEERRNNAPSPQLASESLSQKQESQTQSEVSKQPSVIASKETIQSTKHFKCDSCTAVYEKEIIRDVHQCFCLKRVFHQNNVAPFKCPVCNQHYQLLGAVKTHILQTHRDLFNELKSFPAPAENPKARCKVCRRLYNRGAEFESHVTRQHPGVKPDEAEVKRPVNANASAITTTSNSSSINSNTSSNIQEQNVTVNTVIDQSEVGPSKGLKRKLSNTMVPKEQCVFCERVFKAKGDLDNHVFAVHSSRGFKEKKGHDFTTNLSTNKHSNVLKQGGASTSGGVVRNVTIKPPGVECSVCKRTFRAYQHMQNHFTDVHAKRISKQKKVEHSTHSLSLNTNSNQSAANVAKGDVRDVTAEPPGEECSVCKKSFKTKLDFNNHFSDAHLKHTSEPKEVEHSSSNQSVEKNKNQAAANIIAKEDLKNVTLEAAGEECKVCKRTFNSKLDADNHFSAFHSRHIGEQIKVVLSNLNLSLNENTNQNITKEDVKKSEPPEEECSVCKRAFKAKLDLENHFTVFHPKHINKQKSAELSSSNLAVNKNTNPGAAKTAQEDVKPKPPGETCSVCKRAFTSKLDLKNHFSAFHSKHIDEQKKVEHSSSNLSVNKNTTPTPTDTAREDKVKNITLEAAGEMCKICKQTFKEKVDLESHFSTVHSKPVGEQKNLEHSLNKNANPGAANATKDVRHIQLPTKINCTSCNRSFREKMDLEQHFSAVHKKSTDVSKKEVKKASPELPMIHCEYCPRTFKRKAYMERHVEVNHLKIRKSHQLVWQRCNYCTYIFPGERELEYHISQYHSYNTNASNPPVVTEKSTKNKPTEPTKSTRTHPEPVKNQAVPSNQEGSKKSAVSVSSSHSKANIKIVIDMTKSEKRKNERTVIDTTANKKKTVESPTQRDRSAQKYVNSDVGRYKKTSSSSKDSSSLKRKSEVIDLTKDETSRETEKNRKRHCKEQYHHSRKETTRSAGHQSYSCGKCATVFLNEQEYVKHVSEHFDDEEEESYLDVLDPSDLPSFTDYVPLELKDQPGCSKDISVESVTCQMCSEVFANRDDLNFHACTGPF